MDPFEELLRGVRADGGDLRRSEVIGTVECDRLAVYALVSGWVEVAGETARAGDVLVARGPFTLTGRAEVVTGTYDLTGAVASRLAAVLPEVLVSRGTEGCAEFYGTLDEESGVVADRLLDWIMVCGLRTWFDSEHRTGWFGALADDVAGPALRAMHADPARPWTLALLAREAKVSRTTLAGRFAKLVGTPPLTYLTEWRMALAADLLTDSTATVAAVAKRVGYADAFGFSAAFKRVHGVSPSEYRAGARVLSGDREHARELVVH
ncbi:AraC family transcriptional regulator [Lentzea chajnantorensis]